jgi:hypothetical protein
MKWGHLSIQDTLLGPQGVYNRGVPLYKVPTVSTLGRFHCIYRQSCFWYVRSSCHKISCIYSLSSKCTHNYSFTLLIITHCSACYSSPPIVWSHTVVPVTAVPRPANPDWGLSRWAGRRVLCDWVPAGLHDLYQVHPTSAIQWVRLPTTYLINSFGADTWRFCTIWHTLTYFWKINDV